LADGTPVDGVRARLREALRAAMRRRDPTAVAASRSALAAIGNAEAADLSDAAAIEPGVIAGGVAGLGAGEVPRRELSEREMVELLVAQVAGWNVSATDYERSGHRDEAMRLRAEAAFVAALL
jgi:hypothetical protein